MITSQMLLLSHWDSGIVSYIIVQTTEYLQHTVVCIQEFKAQPANQSVSILLYCVSREGLHSPASYIAT